MKKILKIMIEIFAIFGALFIGVSLFIDIYESFKIGVFAGILQLLYTVSILCATICIFSKITGNRNDV